MKIGRLEAHICFLVCFICPFFGTSVNISIEEKCPAKDKRCLRDYFDGLLLTQRDPVKVGHVTNVLLENEQIREMKTLSMKPPLFEIPHFLSPDECDNIIRLAKKQGLYVSSTMDETELENVQNFMEEHDDVFTYYDYNNDEFLDIEEVFNLVDSELDFSPDREDILKMFKTVNVDKNGDLKISREEFRGKNVRGIVLFAAQLKRLKPYTKSRNSNQTWLTTDKHSEITLQSLRRRLQKLTQLPIELLNSSESLQVVSYGPRGHYNCHMDSDDVDPARKCCHLEDFEPDDCRICRYLTALYFLNDVEEGGETAFPIADNETFDDDAWSKDVKRICNLGRNCQKSNLLVRPEKGKAILWYSHKIHNDTGWLGESDPFSFHGGCDVKKGVKWIANNWISVSENRTEDIELWIRRLRNENAEATRQTTESVTSDNDTIDELLDAVKKENSVNEDETDSVFNALENSDENNMENREDL